MKLGSLLGQSRQQQFECSLSRPFDETLIANPVSQHEFNSKLWDTDRVVAPGAH